MLVGFGSIAFKCISTALGDCKKKKKIILYVGTQNAFIKASLCLGRNDLCSIKAQLKCLLAPYLPRKNILFSSSEHSCLDIEQCFL